MSERSKFNLFYVYRELNNGKYKRVGAIELKFNGPLPFKPRYYTKIGILSWDHGEFYDPHKDPRRI